MTAILIAVVGVLPLAVAAFSVLFVLEKPPRRNPHHHAINLWDLKEIPGKRRRFGYPPGELLRLRPPLSKTI